MVGAGRSTCRRGRPERDVVGCRSGDHLEHMHEAILIIGPTGSGKTPLGEELERTGWRDRRCVHVDFGEQMRRITTRERLPAGFTPGDRDTLRDVLEAGRLLTDEEFHLVGTILDLVAREKSLAAADLVILNGVPRRIGQARDLEALVEIVEVIALEAGPDIITERIRRNSGGDRAGRIDDLPARIRDRLARYEAQTRPLIDYYRRTGVPVRIIPVGIATVAGEVAAVLDPGP